MIPYVEDCYFLSRIDNTIITNLTNGDKIPLVRLSQNLPNILIMKALSIKQPWASLIAHGIKDIENRTWRTHFRGKTYIHTSVKSAGNTAFLLNDEQNNFFTWNTENYKNFESNLHYSAIIGEVDIVDCFINHPSVWAEKLDCCFVTKNIGNTSRIFYRISSKRISFQWSI